MSAPRILILEDDLAISEHLGAIAKRVLSSEVASAASVTEAEIFAEGQILCALLDVDVLDGTTYEFANRLTDRGVPFAFISASDRNKLPASLQSARFVSKPYEEQQIVALFTAWREQGAS